MKKHCGVVLFVCSIACFAWACGSGSDEEKPTWNCYLLSDGCTCSEPRPGWSSNPGGMRVDRCPAAQCCLLNSQSTESTLAFCTCITMSDADDCANQAMTSQQKVVATCPPP